MATKEEMSNLSDQKNRVDVRGGRMKRNGREEMSVRRSLQLLGPLGIFRGTVVVAHPRQLSPELVELLEGLQRHGVRISVEWFSPYYLDCRFSVVLWRQEDEELS